MKILVNQVKNGQTLLEKITGICSAVWCGKYSTVAFLLFTLFYRLVTLQPIEDGGDGLFYWQAIKRLVLGLPYGELTHWSTRFALILPQYLLCLVAGTHPLTYYVFPFILSVAATMAVYLVAKRLYDTRTAAFGAALFMFFPLITRASSQLLPGIYSAAFAVFAFAFLVKFYLSENRSVLWIMVSAFWLFLAYESTIINLFFMPGFVAAFYLVRKRVRDPLIFAALLFCLFLIETALYYVFTGDVLARAHAITENHLESDQLIPVTFFDLLYRVVRPGVYFVIVSVFAFVAIIMAMRKKDRSVTWLISLPVLSYYLLNVFMVKSLVPLVPFTRSQPRYWVAVLPVISLLAALGFFTLMRGMRNRKIPELLPIIILLVPLSYNLFLARSNFKQHPFVYTIEIESRILQAIERKVPLLADCDAAVIMMKHDSVSKRLKKETLDSVLESEGMSGNDYKELRDDYFRMEKSKRLIETMYMPLSKDMYDRYPGNLDFETTTYNEISIIRYCIKNEKGLLEKLIENGNDADVFLVHRRPLYLEKIKLSRYLKLCAGVD